MLAAARPESAHPREGGTSPRADRAFLWLLMGLIGLMPLPLASARPWAWSLAAVLVGALLMAYGLLLSASRRRAHRVPPWKLLTPALIAAPALAWAIVQTLPIDAVPIADPIWAAASRALQAPLAGRVTSDVHATITAIMRVLMYFGIFALAVLLCRSARRARHALAALTAIAAAYALFGLLELFFAPDMLLWFDRWAYQGDLTSTFVNRNSYATFAGLGLLCSLTLLALHLDEAAESSPSARSLAVSLLRLGPTRAALPIFAVIALPSAVLLTHSRGGLLSAAAGSIALLVIFVARRAGRLRFRFALAAITVAVGALLLDLSGEGTLGRFERSVLEREERPNVYRLASTGILDRPLAGHGYGTFEHAFHAYSDGSLTANWDKAHNEYLETAFELGIPAAAALTAALAHVGVSCAVGAWRRRRHALYPALGAAATVLVAVHALVDFSLQMPAVAAFYATILGLGYAQSWRTTEGDA